MTFGISGTAIAYGIGTTASAAASAYGANQANKAADASVGGHNNLIQSYLDSDKEAQQGMWNMYEHGTLDPWQTSDGQPSRTEPYTSSMQAGDGYYEKNGQVMSKEMYAKKSRAGKNDIEKYGWSWVPVYKKDAEYEYTMADGTTPYAMGSGPNASDGKGVLYDKTTGRALTQEEAEQVVNGLAASQPGVDWTTAALPSQYEWKPATAKEVDNKSQNSLEKKQLGFMHEYQPLENQYTLDSLAANARLLPFEEDDARTGHEFNVAKNIAGKELVPLGKDATAAGFNYTIDTLPLKTQAVRDALAMAGRNTEAEAARMAGAEVAQAFNAKQQTLGESIRRTGAVAGSGRMAGLQEDLDMNRVKATAGARVAARQNARASQYDQLAKAIQII